MITIIPTCCGKWRLPCPPLLAILVMAFGIVLGTGCTKLKLNRVSDRLHPSNDRDWSPEQAVLPYAHISGTQYALHNIRNCHYLSPEDYVIQYEDRTIDLSQIETVDFIVIPFGATGAIAHTALSFGLDDGTWLVVSVEIRKERGEKYSALKGFGRNYELMYVLGKEEDLIRLRTDYYDLDVYVYPTVATPEQAQALFVDVIGRMNQLATKPEFYNTLANNCTTNLKDHVNRIAPATIKDSWKLLLPGFSPEYLYEIGLLDQRIPFEDLKAVAYVTDVAKTYQGQTDFSHLIRSKRSRIERYVARQVARQRLLEAGDRLRR